MLPVIYLDNNSTTQTDERVIEAMIPFMNTNYANPSSNHFFGNSVLKIVNEAREFISDSLSVNQNEIYFTSGATESINTSIKGLAFSNVSKRKKIVVVSTEHKAVIESCLSLQHIGYEIVFAPVDSEGLVQIEILDGLLDERTLLLSIMLVNNETGVIQPIKQVTELAKSRGVIVFCDGTQAIGKIEVDLSDLAVDLFCFSAHKFYGPKGIGCLFFSNSIMNKALFEPLLSGGGQENNIRSGTLNVPGIIGMYTAFHIVKKEHLMWKRDVGLLRDKLESEFLKLACVKINGSITHRVFNTSNILFRDIDINVLMANIKNIACSNGSACTSRVIEPSHVLKAMGLNDEDSFSSIRFSLGKYNTKEEITTVINSINRFIDK